jgi:hypothetical protein
MMKKGAQCGGELAKGNRESFGFRVPCSRLEQGCVQGFEQSDQVSMPSHGSAFRNREPGTEKPPNPQLYFVPLAEF